VAKRHTFQLQERVNGKRQNAVFIESHLTRASFDSRIVSARAKQDSIPSVPMS
jgi:hypothetical protein